VVRSVTGAGCRWGEGRALSSSLVRAMAVVVTGVGVQDVPGVGLVPDQQVVERFAPQGSDDPFAVGVHPRSPRRRTHDLDAVGGEDRVEGLDVLRVAVVDQQAQRVDPYARLGG
jgi:hypothetical protein